MKKIFILLFLAWLSACKQTEQKLPDNVFYTCSMDPQVMEKKPGKCPICKMELTKIVIDQNHDSGLQLSEEQIKLANIVTEKAEEGWIGEEKTLNGQIVANENNRTTISSRVKGRIERLYFKNPGEEVREGDILYEIYSEELLTVYKEYQASAEKEKALGNSIVDYTSLKEAARNKLLLWGLTEKQILHWSSLQESRNIFPILSRSKGIVTEINMKEGDYVMEGSKLFELSDFSSVWAEAQLFPEETKAFSDQDVVTVSLAGMPGLEIKGKISQALPELQPRSKIELVRIEIANRDFMLKPGMQAYVHLQSKQHKTLLIPSSAVLQDSKGSMVWVKDQTGTYSHKSIKTGIQNADRVEILNGLVAGEEVVVSGAYLMNSEYVFRKGSEEDHVAQTHSEGFHHH